MEQDKYQGVHKPHGQAVMMGEDLEKDRSKVYPQPDEIQTAGVEAVGMPTEAPDQ